MKDVTDSVLIVRCPYCVAGLDFALMVPDRRGQFLCRDCGHAVRVFEPRFLCACENCGEMGEFLRFTAVPTGVSAA